MNPSHPAIYSVVIFITVKYIHFPWNLAITHSPITTTLASHVYARICRSNPTDKLLVKFQNSYVIGRMAMANGEVPIFLLTVGFRWIHIVYWWLCGTLMEHLRVATGGFSDLSYYVTNGVCSVLYLVPKYVVLSVCQIDVIHNVW